MFASEANLKYECKTGKYKSSKFINIVHRKEIENKQIWSSLEMNFKWIWNKFEANLWKFLK